MTKSNRSILWIPLWFSLIFILFNYLIVGLLQPALTPEAEEVFQQRQGQLFMASALFVFPNLLLTFLLWTYLRTHEDAPRSSLLTLCFTSIAVGVLPILFIYAEYYTLWYEEGANIPVVMFGFPFVYLLGVMMGWVLGLFIVSYRWR